MSPRRPQEASKTRRPLVFGGSWPLRGPKRLPRCPQDASKMPQEAPKRAPRRPKMAPRRPQDALKTVQDGPKMLPRGHVDGFWEQNWYVIIVFWQVMLKPFKLLQIQCVFFLKKTSMIFHLLHE